MEDKKHPLRNNCISSKILQCNGLSNLHKEMQKEFKNEVEEIPSSNPSKKYTESLSTNNINLCLKQFMENQNKKQLSTKFGHKYVEHFLKEKDEAMQEIIVNEEIKENSEIENDDNKNGLKNNNGRCSKCDNNTSHLLIFHGTFGVDEYNKKINGEHHHHHHHHHHRHHHHHNHHSQNEDLSKNNNNNKVEYENKKEKIPIKC